MKKKNSKIDVETAQESQPVGKKRRISSYSVMKYVIAAVLLVVLAYFGFTCEVREGTCAVILRFGAVREEIIEAGLYFRLPWPFESVVTYDNRVQYLESGFLETTTKDKRNIIIQSYAIWEIKSPLKYHNSVGSQGKVDSYIKDQIFSATNSVMGAYNLIGLVSLSKEEIKIDEIQNEIFNRVKENCERSYGILVKDISILRLSLPDTNLESVFEQMKADRQKDIDTILANAQHQANKIIADADAEAAAIIADGTTAAAEINAKTETEVAKIYAEAQAANLELYRFLKQLDTLIASVGESTILVVKADEYPFSILTQYSEYITDEDNEVIINDLSYILTKLPEADRQALIDAIYALMREYTPEVGGQ
ncbi:MAG: SPFH domain-containing protein [Eubacteriales bacterium]|jgi:membrane protease subunit HflC